ncbi:MAG TPA: response regulator [Longimicrobiales bacterium]
MPTPIPSPRRVPVIEDDPRPRSVIVQHLRGLGHHVNDPACVEKVLIAMAAGNEVYELVPTDVHLPGSSDTEFLRTLLARLPLEPIVVMTGDTEEFGTGSDVMRTAA